MIALTACKPYTVVAVAEATRIFEGGAFDAETLGIIVGNRAFFPDKFVVEGCNGLIRTYVGEGVSTDDYLSSMSGTKAVVEVPDLQKLMRYVCKNGFAHHCAMVQDNVSTIVAEAFETYLGWDVYYHEG